MTTLGFAVFGSWYVQAWLYRLDHEKLILLRFFDPRRSSNKVQRRLYVLGFLDV